MKLLQTLFLYFALTLSVFGQAQPWLIPHPNQVIAPNQSYFYNTTNLFLRSFYLGGTDGFTGYFVWNGIKYNSPVDFGILVSNSVAPSNFVYKVDYQNDQSNTTQRIESNTTAIAVNASNIMSEAQFRHLADLSISNFLGHVPTNLYITYVPSPTNFMRWTNNLNNWYLDVCITNGAAGGGGYGTNIINVTNYFQSGDVSYTNTTVITNFSLVSNQFTYVAGDTVISNRINITNNFLPVNNVIAGTTYVTNYFSNTIYAGNTTVSNFNYNSNVVNVTNHITNIVGSVVVTNFITNTFNITNNSITVVTNLVTNNTTVNPSYNLAFNPSNYNFNYDTNLIYITNIVENTNTVIVTNINNITNVNTTANYNNYTNFTLVTNDNNIVNNFGVTNNITNTVVVGDTTVNLTNMFNTVVSNDINVAGVVVTNVITNIIYVTNITQFITQGISNFVSVAGGMTGLVDNGILYLDTSMFPTSGAGSNLISVSIFDEKVNAGIIPPSTAEPRLLGWSGTEVLWTNGLPSGSTITTVLSRLVITNFLQGASTNVDGVVVGVYDNTALSNELNRVDYTYPNKENFYVEQIYGFESFIVSPTSGYHGKLTNAVTGTKLTAGCSLYIGDEYYPIVSISGDGTADDSVVLQTFLPSNTTQTVTAVYGVVFDNVQAKLSSAFNSQTTNGVVRLNTISMDAEYWCASDDFQIQYYISGKMCYKSVDAGKTFVPWKAINDFPAQSLAIGYKIKSVDGTNVYVFPVNTTVATTYPVYLSTNGMRTYADAGWPVDQYHDLALGSTNIIMAVDMNNSQLRISTNAGVTWVTNTVVGARNYSTVACSSNGTVIAVAPYHTSYFRHLYVSTNSGASWVTNIVGSGNNYIRHIGMSLDGSNIVTATTYNTYWNTGLQQSFITTPSTISMETTEPDGQSIAGVAVRGATNVYFCNFRRIYKFDVDYPSGGIRLSETIFGNANSKYRTRIAANGSDPHGYKQFSIDGLYPNVWWLSHVNGGYPYVWLSTDYGENWRLKRTEDIRSGTIFSGPVSRGGVALIPYWMNGTPVTFSTDNRHSILRSDDFGNNWYFVQGRRLPYWFLSMPETNVIYSTLYSNDRNSTELVKSTDGGSTFYLMGGLGERQHIGSVSVASFNGKTNIAIYPFSTIEGFPIFNEDAFNNNTFTPLNTYYVASHYKTKAILYASDKLWLFGAFYRTFTYHENITNYNQSFNTITLTTPYIANQPEQHLEAYYDSLTTNFYMGIYAVTNIFVTTNNFSTIDLLSGSPKCRWNDFSTHNGSIIWAAGSTNATVGTMSGHAFVSIDNGVTWSNKTLGPLGAGSTTYVWLWTVDGTNTYIHFNNRFYKTTDMGTTWNVLYSGLPIALQGMTGDRNNRTVGGPMWVWNNGTTRGQHNVWITTDEFTTLQEYGNPQKGQPEWSSAYRTDIWGPISSPPGQPNVAYVGKRDGFVYHTSDGGTNWVKTDLSTDGLSRDWEMTTYGDTVYATRVNPYLSGQDILTPSNFAEIFISKGNETPSLINPNARVFNRLNIPNEVTDRNLAVCGVAYAGDNLYLDNGFAIHRYNDSGDLVSVPTNTFTLMFKSNIVDTANWATISGVSISDLYQSQLGAYVSHSISFDGGTRFMKYENGGWVPVVTNNAGTYWYRVAEGSYANSSTGLLETISIANEYPVNRFLSSDISVISEVDWLKPNGFGPNTTNILIASTFVAPTTNYNGVARAPSLFNTIIGSTYNTDFFTRRDTNYAITAVGTDAMTNAVRKIGGDVSDAIIYYMKGL